MNRSSFNGWSMGWNFGRHGMSCKISPQRCQDPSVRRRAASVSELNRKKKKLLKTIRIEREGGLPWNLLIKQEDHSWSFCSSYLTEFEEEDLIRYIGDDIYEADSRRLEMVAEGARMESHEKCQKAVELFLTGSRGLEETSEEGVTNIWGEWGGVSHLKDVSRILNSFFYYYMHFR